MELILVDRTEALKMNGVAVTIKIKLAKIRTSGVKPMMVKAKMKTMKVGLRSERTKSQNLSDFLLTFLFFI